MTLNIHVVLLAPEDGKASRNAPRKEIEGVVDTDLLEFDTFFQGLGNEPLSKPEKAVVKTYLAYKLGLVKSGG